nr:hypothetical protein [Tanacetum cinerariifolium]
MKVGVGKQTRFGRPAQGSEPESGVGGCYFAGPIAAPNHVDCLPGGGRGATIHLIISLSKNQQYVGVAQQRVVEVGAGGAAVRHGFELAQPADVRVIDVGIVGGQ